MKSKTIFILFTLLLAACVIAVAVYSLPEDDDVKFTVKDSLPDGEGKVATVIILGGQSNASGCSRDEYLKEQITPEKYEQYKNGFDNVYINYLSGAKRSGEFVKCATLQGEMDGCFGPELGIADRLNELYPDETFFIIKCAWGGTNLGNNWLSPSSLGKTGNLYKQFIEYVSTSIEYLVSKNYDVKIEAMCWMQGESDSVYELDTALYERRLNNFILDIRKQFGSYASDDGIAFVDAYIADNPNYWIYFERINTAKKRVADSSPQNVVIDTISHGLSCSGEPKENPDMAHYDSMSEIKLGHLFADEVIIFLD